jgi:hypothetical protein
LAARIPKHRAEEPRSETGRHHKNQNAEEIFRRVAGRATLRRSTVPRTLAVVPTSPPHVLSQFGLAHPTDDRVPSKPLKLDVVLPRSIETLTLLNDPASRILRDSREAAVVENPSLYPTPRTNRIPWIERQ